MDKDQWRDSIARSWTADILRKAGELPLRQNNDSSISIRLVISPMVINPYVIRVDHHDSTTQVTFRMIRGWSKWMRVDDLSLSYSSVSSGMDSLFASLNNSISSFDFYQLPDGLKNYTIADGTGFTLEYRYKDRYQVIHANKA